MNLNLEQVGKRYRRQWIFRGLQHSLQSGQRWALSGPNGSGKSTLIGLLSGAVRPSEGVISWVEGGEALPPEQWYKRVSIAAPYMELIEPFSLREMLDFHAQLKPWRGEMGTEEVIDACGLRPHSSKALRDYSSGMKQRVRLALALFSQSDLLLLDEPGSNLDERGRRWYEAVLEQEAGERLVVIASNLSEEIRTCTHTIALGTPS